MEKNEIFCKCPQKSLLINDKQYHIIKTNRNYINNHQNR